MKEKGLRKLSTFLTADALLAAVLLVWAQFWAQPSLQLWSRYYQLECGNIIDEFKIFNTSAGAGLVFTYAAVALALLALAWAGWRSFENHEKDAPTAPTALGLFSAALLFGIFNVLQSMASVGIKLIKGEWIYETYALSYLPSWCLWVGAFLFIFFILVAIYAFHWKAKKDGSAPTGWWKCILDCKQLSWLSWEHCWEIEAVFSLGFAGLWLWSGWGGLDKPCNAIILSLLIASMLVILLICVLAKKPWGFREKKDKQE